ncbi:MAG TPA: divalent-cation tolerance protein CutA [Acidimicrobiales bacterium]|nr:divalent-cation tolerance protein CutA [Acidimicrobiales bacterium]
MDRETTGWLQVQVAAGSREEADGVASAVLGPRLAACVQVVGPVESRFWWEGRLDTATEWLCLIKTTDERLDAVVATIRDAHSYDTPEIIAVPVVGGDEAYLRWVTDVTDATDVTGVIDEKR